MREILLGSFTGREAVYGLRVCADDSVALEYVSIADITSSVIRAFARHDVHEAARVRLRHSHRNEMFLYELFFTVKRKKKTVK